MVFKQALEQAPPQINERGWAEFGTQISLLASGNVGEHTLAHHLKFGVDVTKTTKQRGWMVQSVVLSL